MGGSSKAPAGYQPANQAGADQSYQAFINDIGSLYGQQGGVNSQLAQQSSAVQANPYYQTAIQGANSVAQQSQGVGQQQIAAGNQLYGLSSMAQPMATQINQTAFDPQSALYNQQYQQQQDQTNAVNAQNGVAGSPFAAGLSGMANQNFNMNWQNNQLARQATGTNAISQLGQYATGLNTAGAALGSQGLTTQAQGSALPSNTYLQQGNANIAALQALSGGYSASAGIAGMGSSADATYLGLGQSATKNAQNATEINNASNQAMWSGLLKAGGLAADIFGGPIGSAISGLGGAASSAVPADLVGLI